MNESLSCPSWRVSTVITYNVWAAGGQGLHAATRRIHQHNTLATSKSPRFEIGMTGSGSWKADKAPAKVDRCVLPKYGQLQAKMTHPKRQATHLRAPLDPSKLSGLCSFNETAEAAVFLACRKTRRAFSRPRRHLGS